MINRLLEALLKFLEVLNIEKFRFWIANYNPTNFNNNSSSSSESISENMNEFYHRIIILIGLFIIHCKDGDKLKISFTLQLSKLVKSSKSAPLQLPYYLDNFLNKTNVRYIYFDFLSFCTNVDDPLIILHCKESYTTVPHRFKNGIHNPKLLRRMILTVDVTSKIVYILEPAIVIANMQIKNNNNGMLGNNDKNQNSGSSSNNNNTSNEVAAVDEEIVYAKQTKNTEVVDTDLSHNQNSSSNNNNDIEEIKAPTLEKTLEERMQYYYDILKIKLEKAREKLFKLTPLENLIRFSEKEFLSINISYTGKVAVKYKETICPLLLKLKNVIGSNVEDYVQLMQKNKVFYFFF
jgi:hypothetical protein